MQRAAEGPAGAQSASGQERGSPRLGPGGRPLDLATWVSWSLAAAGFLLLFRSAMVDLVRLWWENPDFSHGFLIPPIAAWILWKDRAALRGSSPGAAWPGLAVVLASILLFLGASAAGVDFVQRVAMWGALVGGLLFLLGRAWIVRAAFPLGFLLLSIPPPSFLLTPVRVYLKEIVTRLASQILVALDYSAMREGNVLVVDAHRLEVADACSGIRSLMVILATAILLAYLCRAGFWRGGLLALTGIPVTVLANLLRVLLVAVVLAATGHDLSLGLAHDLLGLATFALGLLMLFASWRLYAWVFPRRQEGCPT